MFSLYPTLHIAWDALKTRVLPLYAKKREFMKKHYQITSDGKKELEQELTTLKARRGAVAEKIAEARDFGDLSENAEYDAAREEQGLLETRIAEIEDIVNNAEIIKSSRKKTIDLGSKVELKTDGKIVAYTIVGPVEADPLAGKISNESPIGMALYGKKVGDSAVITTPRGDVTYKISQVS
ncbi:MAG: greA [Candidatus Saccharibacteria bacterium]|nr:greA [Candidatus Saccharibacteria bacterium]